MNEFIIGSSNEHIIKSIKHKIPIILTNPNYLEYENCQISLKIKEINISLKDMGIAKKPISFSKRELREKLLFVAELCGLIKQTEVTNIYINILDSKLTVYGNNQESNLIDFQTIYILDSHQTTYSSNFIIEGEDWFEVIDVYRHDKCARIYVRMPLNPIEELYFFDNWVFIISKIKLENIDEWENSSIVLRNMAEESLLNKYKFKSLSVSLLERVCRPLWISKAGVVKKGIKYELD